MDPWGWLPFSGVGLEEAVEILSKPQNRMFEITIEHVRAVCLLLHPLRRSVFRDRWWQLLIDVGLSVVGARRRFRQCCRGLEQFEGEHCWQRRRKRRRNRSVHNFLYAPSGLLVQDSGRNRGCGIDRQTVDTSRRGAAIFETAEVLQVDYGCIALAGLIPATAFHVAIFSPVDLRARKTGAGTSAQTDISSRNSPSLRASMC